MQSSGRTGVLRGRLGLRFLLHVLIHLNVGFISLLLCSCSISCTTSISVFFVLIVVVNISSSVVAVLPIYCLPVSSGMGAGDDLLGSHVLEGQSDGVSFPIPGSELSLRQVGFLFAHFDMGGLGVNLGLDLAVGEGVHLYIRVLNVGEYVNEVGVISGMGKEVVKVDRETG